MSFNSILARAVLEHLDIDLLTAVNECWRVLKPNGEISIKLPYWNHERSYDDPTHRYAVGLGVFDVFDPTTLRGKEYHFYTDRKWKLTKVALNNVKSSVWGWMTKVES
jgi:ubiquinone/menaquinone biosynthesis C-methylase UbiE